MVFSGCRRMSRPRVAKPHRLARGTLLSLYESKVDAHSFFSENIAGLQTYQNAP